PLRPPSSSLFPYTTLFRSRRGLLIVRFLGGRLSRFFRVCELRGVGHEHQRLAAGAADFAADGPIVHLQLPAAVVAEELHAHDEEDRKSTRLNSSHDQISYA